MGMAGRDDRSHRFRGKLHPPVGPWGLPRTRSDRPHPKQRWECIQTTNPLQPPLPILMRSLAAYSVSVTVQVSSITRIALPDWGRASGTRLRAVSELAARLAPCQLTRCGRAGSRATMAMIASSLPIVVAALGVQTTGMSRSRWRQRERTRDACQEKAKRKLVHLDAPAMAAFTCSTGMGVRSRCTIR